MPTCNNYADDATHYIYIYSNHFCFNLKKNRPGLPEAQSPFSLSPVGKESQRLLQSPRKSPRKIAAVPFKVLDAPDLQDDFYLNLVDWSSQNQLCVGLGSCVYLWSACTSKVTKLCDLSSVTDGQSDTITSVNWMQRGSHLAVGTEKGLVHLWDAQKCKLQQTFEGHDGTKRHPAGFFFFFFFFYGG